MTRYTFSGHESFHCKSLWLKKGYDFAKEGKSFNDENAVVDLGVGKNMVASIRFWLKSFGVLNEHGEVTAIGDYLLADNGKDPYIEDISTVWLLHYLLVHTNYATLYNVVFCEFNRTRRSFSKQNLLDFMKRLFADKRFDKLPYNENTISRDIATLLKNYVRPDSNKSYDDFSALLLDLQLIKKRDRDEYEFCPASSLAVHPLIFLYALLDYSDITEVIDYNDILQVANIFALSNNDLYEIFDRLHKLIPAVSFTNTAGEQLFTIREPLNKTQVLDMYYQ